MLLLTIPLFDEVSGLAEETESEIYKRTPRPAADAGLPAHPPPADAAVSLKPNKPTVASASPDGTSLIVTAYSGGSFSDIHRWEYRYKPENGTYGAWTALPGSAQTPFTYTATGLTTGTYYIFQTRLCSADGCGPASDESDRARPTAPTGVYLSYDQSRTTRTMMTFTLHGRTAA